MLPIHKHSDFMSDVEGLAWHKVLYVINWMLPRVFTGQYCACYL